ncbi:nucleoporin NUP152-like isoform X1 [Amaranthus tricolor]|uniref:nucleoporin NUP152-like isoform X1 n=1 Tax=Amaranthus tricolor TaxID=29722 RepID=UPI00258F6493|nr:nucleoporin NUP152-like isoform X1 [Amaranthus tricolor]
MIGTKRRSVSLSSNADDNPFQSKKTVAESPVGGQETAVLPSPEVKIVATPSLDRRKAAQQHVRALNTEFASWVQCQLRDHPDELWEDGLKDYVSQASNIREKFTDVVNWLKAKTDSEGSTSFLGTQVSEKQKALETNIKDLKSSTFVFGSSANTGFIPPSNSGTSSTTSVLSSTSSAPSWSFGLSASSQALSQDTSAPPVTSWSSGVSLNTKSVSPVKTGSLFTSPSFGVSSNNQATSSTTTSFMKSTSSGIFPNKTPSFGSFNVGIPSNGQATFTFGNHKPDATNESNKEDVDDDNEPEQPSSPSVKSSEEKGITVVHETKCKLYVKSTDPADKEPWKDKGAGKLFIKCLEAATKGTKESKPRILVRNDVGRIMLNASLYPGIKTSLQKNAIVTIFHTSEDSGENVKAIARTFLIRVKNEEERDKLADTIREHAPMA